MHVRNAKVGGLYIVQAMHEEEKVLRRLEALGILEGTKIELLNRKKNGASIIKVRGARWALGNDIACGIDVEEYRP